MARARVASRQDTLTFNKWQENTKREEDARLTMIVLERRQMEVWAPVYSTMPIYECSQVEEAAMLAQEALFVKFQLELRDRFNKTLADVCRRRARVRAPCDAVCVCVRVCVWACLSDVCACRSARDSTASDAWGGSARSRSRRTRRFTSCATRHSTSASC